MQANNAAGAITAVTGASGHVGANLVRMLLAQHRKVRAIVKDDKRALDGLDVEIASADVLEPGTLETAFAGVGVVYHLAARISVWGGDGGAVEAVNVEGARNVAAACIKSGVRRLIHFSSIHAIAQQPREETLDETREFVGEHALAYDRSKALGEQAVLDAAGSGLDVVIISPTGIIGPLDFKPSPMGEVILSLMNRSLPALVNGGFDWVDVRDVCQAAIAAERHGKPGEKYLLSGNFMNFKEMAGLVEKHTGAKAPRLYSPIWLAKVGAPFSTALAKITGRRPLYTLDSLKILETCNPKISSKKARRELGFCPRPIESTIADTCMWFQTAAVSEN
jgi:dihydroflavonol-4-reductase